MPFLNELLRLFGYPSGSAGALLAGTLPLRYCTTRFAGRIPTWRLPVPGHAASLVTAGIEVPSALGIEVSCQRVHFVGGSGPARKRIRLNRKTPARLVGLGIHSRPRLWKRLCHVGLSGISTPDHTRRRCDQAYGRFCFPLFLTLKGGVLIRIMRIWFLLKSGQGLDDFLGSLQAHAIRSVRGYQGSGNVYASSLLHT